MKAKHIKLALAVMVVTAAAFYMIRENMKEKTDATKADDMNGNIGA
jgi:hypothetical protein